MYCNAYNAPLPPVQAIYFCGVRFPNIRGIPVINSSHRKWKITAWGFICLVQKVVGNNIDEYIIGSGKMVELVSDICLHRESFQYTLLLTVLCILAVYVHVYIDNTSVSYLCVHVHVPFHGCGGHIKVTNQFC